MPRRFDFVSPGVQLTEIDQSTVPTTLEGDGPLIVGRALKGPANVPVRVRSYDDFVAIFGEPVYGPTETIPDTWRNGNTVAPQYGAIAAQMAILLLLNMVLSLLKHGFQAKSHQLLLSVF
jgi:hypothetical protein